MSNLRDKRRVVAKQRRKTVITASLYLGLLTLAWVGVGAAVYAAYRLAWFVVSGIYAAIA